MLDRSNAADVFLCSLPLTPVEKEMATLHKLLHDNDSQETVKTEVLLRWQKRIGADRFLFDHVYKKASDRQQLLREWPLMDLKAFMASRAEWMLRVIQEKDERLVIFQRVLTECKTVEWFIKKNTIRPADCVHVVAYRKLFKIEGKLVSRYEKMQEICNRKTQTRWFHPDTTRLACVLVPYDGEFPPIG